MRDILCREEFLDIVMECNDEFINEALKEIDILILDSEKGIQRYPISNQEAISRKKESIFQWINEKISAGYSLGLDCKVIEEMFNNALTYIKDIRYMEIGYIQLLKFVSLSILLEICEEKFKVIVDVLDEEEVNDVLLDCMINAYGIRRKIHSTKYEKEIPYKEAVRIMEIGKVDIRNAATKLEEYIQIKWLKGHSDYGWVKAHKEEGYYGLWSFEAAAIAKIFNLDDSKLKDDNHYPYDLTHYKNDMTFNKEIDIAKEEVVKEIQIDKFIPENPELEEIIPNKFRDEINQLLVDFSALGDKEFWEKYNLVELWYTVDDYKNDKNNKDIIGSIVINQLVASEYILQLDYKEEIEDYVDSMKNYWKDQDIKLVRFELDNDQYYYAKVPISCKIENIYEVNIYE